MEFLQVVSVSFRGLTGLRKGFREVPRSYESILESPADFIWITRHLQCPNVYGMELQESFSRLSERIQGISKYFSSVGSRFQVVPGVLQALESVCNVYGVLKGFIEFGAFLRRNLRVC